MHGLVQGAWGVEPDSQPRARRARARRDQRLGREPRAGGRLGGRLAIETCRLLGVEVVLVTEEEIRSAFRFLYGRAKLAAEPGGAAAVAAVLAGKVDGDTVVAVVSGGNVSPDIASAILARP